MPLRLLAICFVMLVSFACRHKKDLAKNGHAASKDKSAPAVAKPMPSNAHDDWQRMLGISSRDMRNNKLYSFIGEWYGTPYKYGGCKKAGIDCSCFANLLSEKVYNRTLPRSANDMFIAAEKFELRDAREGDLVFFKINSKNVSHVGVYLGKRLFVHASSSQGVSVNSLDEAYYKKYFFCAGRMKGR
jgi:murein DD-endopeptidase / murein LD-carboxypeptidase